MYYERFGEYVSVSKRKEKAEKELNKLRKKSNDVNPVVIEGRKIAKTWWGSSWNKNLERYSDYNNRIGRGRSYVRNGAVVDLKINPTNVLAKVVGSRLYNVSIRINPLKKSNWNKIIKDSEGNIDSLQELLEGNFPEVLRELFFKQDTGLFPVPKEINFACDCPDWAYMCKHIAAVLYGIGARLDDNPSLFFVLRDVNIEELISKAVLSKSEKLLRKSKIKSNRVIKSADLDNMFGIELD